MEKHADHPLNGRHNLDSAIGSLIRFYRQHFKYLFLIALGFSLLAALVSELLINSESQQEMIEKIQQNPEASLSLMRNFFISLIPIIIVSLMGFVAISYYILKVPYGCTIIETLTMGLSKYFLTYLVIIVLFIPLFIIASVAGVLLLVVGILFSTLWVVTLSLFMLPALMLENNLIGNAITSSFRLMHRNFWKSIGWTALMVVIITMAYLFIFIIISVPFAAGSIFDALGGGDPISAATTSYATNPIYIILSSAASALIMPVPPILGFILYFNARSDGRSPVALLTEDENLNSHPVN